MLTALVDVLIHAALHVMLSVLTGLRILRALIDCDLACIHRLHVLVRHLVVKAVWTREHRLILRRRHRHVLLLINFDEHCGVLLVAWKHFLVEVAVHMQISELKPFSEYVLRRLCRFFIHIELL